MILDTNVVARTLQRKDKHHQSAVDAIDKLAQHEGEELGITAQSVYELWVLMTRSTLKHGFGFPAAQAVSILASVQDVYTPVVGGAISFHHWQNLLTKYHVAGKEAFDLIIVATMLEHRHSRLLTFNENDFNFMTEVETITPWSVLGIPPLA